MKTVRFHEAAQQELAEEALYDAAISSRLGGGFVAAVEATLRPACEFPAAGLPYRYKTRRVFPKNFRFSIIYVERAEELYVLAVAPFSRKPGYWRSRR